jgi:UPF0755 protein
VTRRLAVVAGAAVLAGLAVLWYGWALWTHAPSPSGPGPFEVRITPGMSLRAAADTLAARGLLQRKRIFLVGARLTGRDRGLKAGLYAVEGGLAPRDLLEALTAGPTVQVKVTVPEGFDAEEAAAALAGALGFDAASFLAAADSLALALWGPGVAPPADGAGLPRTFRPSEGLLAPDTYHFGEGTDPVTAARHLVEVQRSRVDSVLAAPRPPATADLTPHQLVTLASIVEAEARRADERRRIAAVYVNRLERGRRLEADPTVAYILRKKGRRLYYKDLETASPYNTYRNAGLPPGPIANPGRAALEAAARPDTSSRDLFFVSDGEGGHVFSRTAAEHEEAVREFRRKRAAQTGGR